MQKKFIHTLLFITSLSLAVSRPQAIAQHDRNIIE
jgi:hypothetical protein